jgi:hypothetical protein
MAGKGILVTVRRILALESKGDTKGTTGQGLSGHSDSRICPITVDS